MTTNPAANPGIRRILGGTNITNKVRRKHPTPKWQSLQCAIVVIGIFLRFQSVPVSGAEGVGPISENLTFESFLRNPPIIAKVVYQENMAHGKTIDCELKSDHENYLLSVLNSGSGSGGSFGGIQWALIESSPGMSFLTISDPSRNSKANIPSIREKFSRYSARRFLNLGFYEIIPGTIKWQSGNNRFTAACEVPGALRSAQMEVELKYENGVPVEATGKTDSGINCVVRYNYDPGFCEGRLPSQVTRYFDVSLGEAGRAYTIVIKELQISHESIPKSEFDPQEALKGRYLTSTIWSNDVRYYPSPSGKLIKAQ